VGDGSRAQTLCPWGHRTAASPVQVFTSRIPFPIATQRRLPLAFPRARTPTPSIPRTRAHVLPGLSFPSARTAHLAARSRRPPVPARAGASPR